MLLMPDPNTAYIDPFFDETTLVLSCDVIDPADGKGYDRDPRSIANRAEAYLKSSGIGDTAFFGPEPEFFIFDSVEWKVACPARTTRSSPKKVPGRPTRSSKAATPATVPP
jgi:glutamine synthetase